MAKSAVGKLDAVAPARPLPYVVLAYHSVGAGVPLELDVDLEVFRAQMSLLARRYRVVPLDDLVDALGRGRTLPDARDRPAVVLTFDDAYRSFATVILPILEEYDFPATLYVPTGAVDTGARFPWTVGVSGRRPELLRPLSWAELESVAASSLVTIGNHTHSHPRLDEIPLAAVEEEVVRAAELLRDRLGVRAEHFCYPEGRYSDAVVEVIRLHARSGVIGRVGKGAIDDLYLLRRTAPLRSDPQGLLARALRGEDAAYNFLRALLGRA